MNGSKPNIVHSSFWLKPYVRPSHLKWLIFYLIFILTERVASYDCPQIPELESSGIAFHVFLHDIVESLGIGSKPADLKLVFWNYVVSEPPIFKFIFFSDSIDMGKNYFGILTTLISINDQNGRKAHRTLKFIQSPFPEDIFKILELPLTTSLSEYSCLSLQETLKLYIKKIPIPCLSSNEQDNPQNLANLIYQQPVQEIKNQPEPESSGSPSTFYQLGSVLLGNGKQKIYNKALRRMSESVKEGLLGGDQ